MRFSYMFGLNTSGLNGERLVNTLSHRLTRRHSGWIFYTAAERRRSTSKTSQFRFTDDASSRF
mgnify:CR=1 FL=1|jgi:hypothetical protein